MSTTIISAVHAREILDSRGNPTVEVDITLNGRIRSRAAVPSGASTGMHEAVELRDNDDSRFQGKGVLNAVRHVNEMIAPKILGMDACEQEWIDHTLIALDGTPDKRKLGANAILGVSLAVVRSAAAGKGMPLYRYLADQDPTEIPVPMMNVLNGGVHAHWQGADFQEYMIVPYGAPDFHTSLQWGADVYHTLMDFLTRKRYPTAVGDEGGFAPPVSSNEEPLELILQAIEAAGFATGKEVGIALDPASSAFFGDGVYHLRTERRDLHSGEMIDWYRTLTETYPIISIEDGLAETDWNGWRELTRALGMCVELVGDDVFVTSPSLVRDGIRDNVANAVLIKPNQIGTVTETIETAEIAHHAGWGMVISHRSGETTDSFIADLAVALNAGKIKTGAPCRGERVEKYNQLLRIEEEMADAARFAGQRAFMCR